MARTRGGIPLDTLEALVDEGLSTRQIGARVGRSQATVKYWLRRYGLKTLPDTVPARGERGIDPDRKVMNCRRHGPTEFWLDGRGIYRCLRCRSMAVSKRRRRVKEILVAEAGGRCAICGYDRHVGALQFHHRDASTKLFGLGSGGMTRSLDAARAEAA